MKKLILTGAIALTGCMHLNAQYWTLWGNSGTVDGTHFIGTTDNVPLNFKAQGLRAGRLDNNLQHTSFGINAGINSVAYGTTAFGYTALLANTSGNSNSAFGSGALTANTIGGWNTAVGAGTLRYCTAAYANTAIGNGALLNTTTGGYNTASGINALSGNLTGYGNCGYGSYSGYSSNSDYNTAIGYFSLATAGMQYNTCLGAFANISSGSITDAMALGTNAIVNASNKCRIGNTFMGITECQNGVYTVSDGRFKNNMSEKEVKGLEFIKLLRPVVYNFDTKAFTEFLTKNVPDSLKKNYLNKDFNSSSSVRQTGFIAQEVEKAARQTGFNFNGLHAPVDENDNYSINYGQFVVPLVKGMQEQQEIIDKLLNKIELLEAKFERVAKATVTDIEQESPAVSTVLEQNQPNPFNEETVIKYSLSKPFHEAFIAVYDLTGKQIASFPITQHGQSSITISSEKLAAGIYIYSMIADGEMLDAKRLIVTER